MILKQIEFIDKDLIELEIYDCLWGVDSKDEEDNSLFCLIEFFELSSIFIGEAIVYWFTYFYLEFTDFYYYFYIF